MINDTIFKSKLLFIFEQSLNYLFSIESLKNNQYPNTFYIAMSYTEQICQAVKNCENCFAKQITIEKFVRLTSLLRKKAKKYDASKSKSSLSCQSNHRETLDSQLHAQKGHYLVKAIRNIEKKHSLSSFYSIKFFTMINRHSPLHMGSLYNDTKSRDGLISLQTSPSLCDLGKIPVTTFGFSSKNQEEQSSYKGISLKEIFSLRVKNRQLQQKIEDLQKQVDQGLKRQEKEMAKKRQSLSGLVQQLGQKNQIIEDLKNTISQLERRLGAKQNGILQCMLQQDTQYLTKAVYRLQNINDKLNIQIKKTRQQKSDIAAQNISLKRQIDELKVQLMALKEQNFELEHQKIHANNLKKQIEFISHRTVSKMDRIHKFQRQLNIQLRTRQKNKETMFANTLQSKLTKKGSVESSDSLAIHQYSTIQDLQHKLQSVFIYLFHIEDAMFTLGSSELFDSQEKELLVAHKQKFNIKQGIFEKAAKINQIQNDHFGESILQAFSPQKQDKLQCNHVINLTQTTQHLEKQREILREKISELKQRSMYVRNVLLSLLRSLDLKSIKKDTEGIVNMLADYFEYSEAERSQIFQHKQKKMFGFI